MKTSFLTPLLAAVLAAGLALAAGPAAAASDDDPATGGATTARSDRLDIFGAGMCHQCEWRPRPKLMAAGDQCGVDAAGKPRPGVYECGRNTACEPVCNFVSCDVQ